MTASELAEHEACCKTCVHFTEHKAGITFTVCGLRTDYYGGLGQQVFKVDEDFVCADWEELDELGMEDCDAK